MDENTYQLMTEAGWIIKTIDGRKEWVHKNGFILPSSSRKVFNISTSVPYHASEQVRDHVADGLTPAPF